jgi:L-threonylcarbamoyladenylate synthase
MDTKSPAFDIDLKQIEIAVSTLRAGDLVAFPTETVYGLGASAINEHALRRLFKVKGRPENHPVIVHLAHFNQVYAWAREVPESARILAERFWPGPLTMILKRASRVSDLITGGQDTIGLRIPNHPVALALLKAFGEAVAAPSANRFGRVSPTTAQDVRNELGSDVACVLDGGNCQVGIESTIVDLTQGKATILRPGMISENEINSLLGGKSESSETNPPSIRVPGSLARHYATQTPIKLKSLNEIHSSVITSPGSLGSDEQPRSIAVLSFADKPKNASSSLGRWIKISSEADEYARDLYRSLRELDRSGARVILVEELPQGPDWLAVKDRLSRAATTQT